MQNSVKLYFKELGEVTREELEWHVEFLSHICQSLNRFEVWEVENIYDEEDEEKKKGEILDVFENICNAKAELENKLYNR
ncbi:hypothetical protein MOB65_20130 [Bacillus inaquosorum]|uniref:hypothetical protein n=1 Tax=Bacillus inaquosorum TaxID=483913 RepID=UPI0022829B60|nr:hypothetical protein [Bacillus inaquosorum]MCY7911166.1 hypothetical protein [Bacillus inaquosorum]